MRTDEDIFLVHFEVQGSVSLDMERIEADPAWQNVLRQSGPIDSEEKFRTVLQQYLNTYLSREILLEEMPSTNGPANLYGNSIRFKSEGNKDGKQ